MTARHRGGQRGLSLLVATGFALASTRALAFVDAPASAVSDSASARDAESVDTLMNDAASRMRIGDYEEALDRAARAMTIAIESGDRTGEQRIAILVGQWSWEAYASNHAIAHLERCERILDQLGALDEADERVGRMATALRSDVESERTRLQAQQVRPPPPKLEPRDVSAPVMAPSKRSPASVAMVATGSAGLAAAAVLIGVGAAFLRGLPRAEQARQGHECTNCARLGTGYAVAGSALAGIGTVLVAVGARRLHERARARTIDRLARGQFMPR